MSINNQLKIGDLTAKLPIIQGVVWALESAEALSQEQ